MGVLSILLLMSPLPAQAQSRGVYPLGMTSTNSGITPPPGFSYSNQLLFYSRNESKDEHGVTKPVRGSNAVLMDMNSIIWVSSRTLLGGAHYSAIATLPFAKQRSYLGHQRATSAAQRRFRRFVLRAIHPRVE